MLTVFPCGYQDLRKYRKIINACGSMKLKQPSNSCRKIKNLPPPRTSIS